MSAKAKILFVQPLSLAASGGAARIFRNLAAARPGSVVSVNAEVGRAAGGEVVGVPEHAIPLRPEFGRLNRSSLHRYLQTIEPLFIERHVRQLMQVALQNQVTAIHGLAHAADFISAFRASQRLNLPFFLTVHDDYQYLRAGDLARGFAERALGEAWRAAEAVFCISNEIGAEYCRRYGARHFEVVTDGAEHVPQFENLPAPPANGATLYMFGLMHNAYEANLVALGRAMNITSSRGTHGAFRCRTGGIQPRTLEAMASDVTVLPYVDFAELNRTVAADLVTSSILYLPLPFEAENQNFGRFSLSTKMVSYLTMGRPILYHGPPDTAAANLLREYDAAQIAASLDPEELARSILAVGERSEELVGNARRLAHERFDAERQVETFWRAIEKKRPRLAAQMH